MSELRQADALAREQALDVQRSFIVQAPAGAGKTELLTRRFLALLATVAEPESILAITFTRKAAAEMRSRILGALAAARSPDPEPPQHARTLGLARAALAADARRGWNLLAQPNRLRILTIDALNLALARRLPVLSGLGAGLGIEEDARELYRSAAERLLDHLPQGSPAAAAAVATLLAHVDNRVERFVDLVVEMLARREAWLPLLPAELPDGPPGDTSGAREEQRLRRRFEAARHELVAGHLQSLNRALPDDWQLEAASVAVEAARNLRAAGVESPVCAWQAGAGPPGDGLDSVPLWQGLAQLLLTVTGAPRRRFDKDLGFPPGATGKPLKDRAIGLAVELARREDAGQLLHEVRSLPPAEYDEDEWRVLLAELRVLRLAAAELELVFAGQRVADYPRHAWAAREALGTPEAPTDTALALDAVLRHVLVDEFQDTSEAQVKLLEALTAGWQPGDGRTLFLVGDPMQSIYRFRAAEVGLFLDIRRRGLGVLQLEPLTLAVNFRSTAPVVDWVNDCFARVLPRADDVLRGAVSYAPCVPRPGAAAEGGVRVHALPQRSRRREAAQVAAIVQERLAADPAARVGILVQGRSHLVDIVGELARAGIAFRAADIDPLGGRPAVLDLLALARALAHPGDRPAWLAVLRAPWCGLTLEALHVLAGDDHESTLPELLGDAGRRARLAADSRERLEATWSVLRTASAELGRLGLRDAVERAWDALGGPATLVSERGLEEADAFLDTLAGLEARQTGPADLAQLARALESLYAPTRERPDVRVELLTVHKAKGLQYDTVIVPALERGPGRDSRRLLHWLKLPRAGSDGLVVAPVARSGAEPNPLYAWIEALEREKLLQERRRLLYVAATRAVRWLHLFGSVQVRDADETPAIVRPRANSALGLLWTAVSSEFEERLTALGAPGGEPEPDRERGPPLERLPPSWDAPPPPPAPAIAARALPRAASEPAVRFDWASEAARHVGTVVHRELQHAVRTGSLPDAAEPHRQHRWRLELAELGVPEPLRAAAVERVAYALARTLADGRGRWLLDPGHRDSRTELALTGREGDQLVRVVVDRSFVDTAGVRWIVDYKTSRHEGAGLEDFLDREQQRYAPQLARYAVLLRRLGPQPVRLGLYFPLLSAWREWPAA